MRCLILTFGRVEDAADEKLDELGLVSLVTALSRILILLLLLLWIVAAQIARCSRVLRLDLLLCLLLLLLLLLLTDDDLLQNAVHIGVLTGGNRSRLSYYTCGIGWLLNWLLLADRELVRAGRRGNDLSNHLSGLADV